MYLMGGGLGDRYHSDHWRLDMPAGGRAWMWHSLSLGELGLSFSRLRSFLLEAPDGDNFGVLSIAHRLYDAPEMALPWKAMGHSAVPLSVPSPGSSSTSSTSSTGAADEGTPLVVIFGGTRSDHVHVNCKPLLCKSFSAPPATRF